MKIFTLQDSVTAIPLEEWNLAFVKPSLLCTIQDNKCIDSKYPTPKDTITVDISDDQSPPPPNILDPNAKPKYLQGPVSLSTEINNCCLKFSYFIVSCKQISAFCVYNRVHL